MAALRFVLGVALVAAGVLVGCSNSDAASEDPFLNIRRPLFTDRGSDGNVLERSPLAVDDPNDVDIVLSDAELKIPGLGPQHIVFNPSMVDFGEGAIVAFRRDDARNDPDMRIGLIALDGNFAPVGQPVYLDLRPPNHRLHTAEDPRLFWHNEELFLVINQRLRSESYYPRVMFLARIGRLPEPAAYFAAATSAAELAQAPSLTAEVTRLARLVPPAPLPFSKLEKNWAPFSANGELKLIYQSNPPIVLTVSQEQLAGAAASITPATMTVSEHKVPYAWGNLRGGTGAFLRADEGLCRPGEARAGDANEANDANALLWRARPAGLTATPPPGSEPLAALLMDAWQPFARAGAHSAGELSARREALRSRRPRGALPARARPAVFEAFFHTRRDLKRKKRPRPVFTIGYYTFATEPPHDIERILPQPLLLPSALEAEKDERATILCSYPGGFVRRDDAYYLIYGHQDEAIRIVKLDACGLWAQTVAAR